MTRPASLHQIGGDDPALKFIRMCLYAHPGEGKTAFWGTGNDSVLFLDSDPGMGTQTAYSLGSNAYVMPVIDYDDLETAYQFVKHDLRKEMPSVRWVVWDSATLFQDRALIDDVMPDAVAENPRQEEFVPSKREYLINMNRMGRYFRQFVELPINFGVSAHVMVTADPDGGSTLYMPQVQGKNMPSKLTGYMNVVGYMGKATVDDKKVQRILFRREGKFYAKDRFNALGAHVDKPTLPKIEGLIEAARKQQAATRKAQPAATAPRPIRRRPTTNATKES